MKKEGILALVFGTVALTCLLVFAVVPYFTCGDVVYSGQEVFQTQSSYEEFKAELKGIIAEDNLKLVDFDVLASEPPIIVNFKVSTPYNYSMPFGSIDEPFWSRVVLTVLIVVVGGGFLIGIPVIVLS